MTKIHYISFLRIIAMFAIIGAHTIAVPVIYYSAEYTDFWLKLSVVVAEILRGGVQVFILISGALFLQPEKELTLNKLFKKYILRIILSLLIFGTLFALMEIVYNQHSFNVSQIWIAFLNMIQNESWGHLWYLYMLAGLYLVTPILKYFTKHATDIEIIYILIVLFLFNILFPVVEKYTGIKIGFYIPFIGTPIFFYILGFTLHSRIIKIPDWLSIAMCVFSISIYIIECCIGTKINISRVIFEGFSNTILFTLIFPIASFSLALNHCKINIGERRERIEDLFSQLSFGVYIFHAVFINFIYKALHLTPNKISVPLLWLLVFCVTSILSLLTTYILRLIPFIKKDIL